MLATDIVERAINAALEQRERGFDGVAVNPARTCVLASAMIRHVMLSEWTSDDMTSIDYGTVGHQMRIRRDVLAKNASKIVRRNVGGYKRPNIAVSLDKRHDRSFASLQPALYWAFAFLLVARLSTDISFIGFHDTGELRFFGSIITHREANSVHQEQCTLVRQSGHSLNLFRANALLAGSSSPKSIAPMAKRNARIFKHGADAHAVLFAAFIALPEKPLIALASLTVGHLVDVNRATVRAAWAAVFPSLGFHKLDRRRFVTASAWEFRHNL